MKIVQNIAPIKWIINRTNKREVELHKQSNHPKRFSVQGPDLSQQNSKQKSNCLDYS